MRFFVIFAIAASISACSRSLTVNETAAMTPFTGSDIEYSEVTVHRGGLTTFKASRGAATIGNEIHWSRENYRDDFLDPNETIYIEDVMLLAHELVHVWQHQNRDTTGYTLSKIAAEHRDFGDAVYEFPTPLDPKRPFSSYRFEQQGAIVEEWVRLAAYSDPQAAVYEGVVRSAMPSLTSSISKRLELYKRQSGS